MWRIEVLQIFGKQIWNSEQWEIWSIKCKCNVFKTWKIKSIRICMIFWTNLHFALSEHISKWIYKDEIIDEIVKGSIIQFKKYNLKGYWCITKLNYWKQFSYSDEKLWLKM